MIYILLHRSANTWTSPHSREGTKDVQAEWIHRIEPPATGRTLRLLRLVLPDAPELRPGHLWCASSLWGVRLRVPWCHIGFRGVRLRTSLMCHWLGRTTVLKYYQTQTEVASFFYRLILTPKINIWNFPLFGLLYPPEVIWQLSSWPFPASPHTIHCRQ